MVGRTARIWLAASGGFAFRWAFFESATGLSHASLGSGFMAGGLANWWGIEHFRETSNPFARNAQGFRYFFDRRVWSCDNNSALRHLPAFRTMLQECRDGGDPFI